MEKPALDRRWKQFLTEHFSQIVDENLAVQLSNPLELGLPGRFEEDSFGVQAGFPESLMAKPVASGFV